MSFADDEGVRFLQWALPRLRFRWAGFRRVRRQVLRRIQQRLDLLGLANLDGYRARLELDPAEWRALDAMCRITVTRFYRDRATWDQLRHSLVPELVERLAGEIRAWSAGCASGEEPFTLSLCWELDLAARFPAASFEIVATDSDERLLERARRARYPRSCLRDLPQDWLDRAFERLNDEWRLATSFRRTVSFFRGDVRRERPDGRFGLVLCRNLAFTYFDEPLQAEVLAAMGTALEPGGYLLVGLHETLPASATDWEPCGAGTGLWRRTADRSEI